MDPALIMKLVEILIAGGIGAGFKNVWDFFIKKQDQATPQYKIATQIELSEKALVSVSSAKDAVEKDNERLRAMRERERDDAEEREAWWREQEAVWHAKLVGYEREIERLKERLNSVLFELDRLQAHARQDREGLEPRD